MKIKLSSFFTLTLCIFLQTTKAQLIISSGAVLNIQNGALVTVQGDVTSNADIFGTGKLLLKGASTQNINMNGNIIPNLELDNVTNAALTGNVKIGTDITFTTGKILQNNFDFTINNSATITGAGSTKYFVTNGTGKLIKANLGASSFTYPVGNSLTTYNPTTLTNSGIADDIAVRCLSNVLNAGSTGALFTKEVADVSWDITEGTIGGSNLSLTTSWSSTDELIGFNRTKSGISYYIPTAGATQGWDLLNSQTSAATGTDPYNYTRSGISSLGIFAVGNRPVLSPLMVAPKVFLQGPYNTGTGMMNDGLRTVSIASLGTTDATHGVIPETEPYTGLTGFTHSGSGGGEKVTPGVFGAFNVTNNDAIVDWVFVQLHDGSTGTVLGTRSALIQRDGDIVETDGVSTLNMAGYPAGNYYLSVRHRNHLGARTLSTITLDKNSTTAYNFTTAVTQAFPGAVSNAPMATLNTGIYGLFAGNANDDLIVKMTGISANNNDYLKLLGTLGSSIATIPGIYSKQDLNMDGTIKMTGISATNNDYLRLLGTLGSSILSLTQPSF